MFGYGDPLDVLLCISTSGNSENVINAAVTARALKLKTIGLMGKTGGELQTYCDVSIIVPGQSTAEIQELHLPIYHTLWHHARKAIFSTNGLKSTTQHSGPIRNIFNEMKKKWLKYSLTILWLFCFFAFKKVYWAEPNTQVAIHLGILEYDDHSKIDARWRSCMSYLSREGICSTIEVGDRSLRGDTVFETWFHELKKHGHQIIYKKQRIDRWNSTPAEPSASPLQINLTHREGALSPSLPIINFRSHFTELVKSTDFFMIKADPSSWNDKQLAYFQENIGYLLQKEINFVHLENENPAMRGKQY